MYEAVKGIHNILRWVVVFSALFALWRIYGGIIAKRAWVKADQIGGLVFTAALGVQFLLGLWLYGISPVTLAAMRDPSLISQDFNLQFFFIWHFAGMLLALVVSQLGYSLAKRAPEDVVKFRRAAIGYTLGAVLIAIAIPWWRPLLPWYLA
ncbi:MAG: hypothetical protein U5L04_14440 [Trueperaceae bacterium]|nr:hypothetical protein [Trueperaceae bacterium]